MENLKDVIRGILEYEFEDSMLVAEVTRAEREEKLKETSEKIAKLLTKKRYLLFTWECYCQIGGWKDFNTSSDNIDELKNIASKVPDIYKMNGQSYQIVDSTTGTIVEEGNNE